MDRLIRSEKFIFIWLFCGLICFFILDVAGLTYWIGTYILEGIFGIILIMIIFGYFEDEISFKKIIKGIIGAIVYFIFVFILTSGYDILHLIINLINN